MAPHSIYDQTETCMIFNKQYPTEDKYQDVMLQSTPGFKIHCYECNENYKREIPVSQCDKCQSVYVEAESLSRKLHPKKATANSERRALWINAFGRIQAAPTIKDNEKSLTNVQLIEQKSYIASGNESDCSICLDQIKQGQNIVCLDTCKHKFHKSCIKQWVAVRNSCPTCNQKAFNN